MDCENVLVLGEKIHLTVQNVLFCECHSTLQLRYFMVKSDKNRRGMNQILNNTFCNYSRSCFYLDINKI